MSRDFEFDELPRQVEALSEVEPRFHGSYEPDPDGGYRWTKAAERLHAEYATRARELAVAHEDERKALEAEIAAGRRQLVTSEVEDALRRAGVDGRDAPLVGALLRRDVAFDVELVDGDVRVRAGPEHGGADVDFVVASFLSSDVGARYAPRPETPREGPLLSAMRRLRDEGAH
jgi:hypothetical protein